jgi:predicted methyltransferase
MSSIEHDNPTEAIPICWVSREDLLAARPDLQQQITALSEDELHQLAHAISDALQEVHQLAIYTTLNALFDLNDAK